MTALSVFFWASVVVVGYIYVGYPLLVMLLASRFGTRVSKAETFPSVSVLIAARNEAACIRETVLNKLAQDYPAERLEIIVVSDESSDGTDAIVEDLGGRVRLIRQQPRAGKTAALNIAVPRARGEVLVFSDANSIYAPDAIRKLAANFADPSVGYVTGKMVYVNELGSLVGDGCSRYMRYENWLRAHESRLGSVIGVDGGIDAVRKALYRSMRSDQLPDFVLPLRVASIGARVVYEPEALLTEAALSDQSQEFDMRVRVSLRALWALWDMRALLCPARNGLLAWQLLSHKLLRYLAFVPLLVCFVSSVLLAPASRVYAVAAIAQCGFYVLAALGWGRRSATPLVTLPHYFVLLNAACAVAAFRFLRGQRQAVWKPRGG